MCLQQLRSINQSNSIDNRPEIGQSTAHCTGINFVERSGINALDAPLSPHPGEVSVRLVEGRLTPVQPAACPLHQDMAEFGVQPVCEKPGQCCTEFVGSTGHGTVRCAALHAARKTEQPLVALIALQKREKLPPPLFH